MPEKSVRVIPTFVGMIFCISEEGGEVNVVMRPFNAAGLNQISYLYRFIPARGGTFSL